MLDVVGEVDNAGAVAIKQRLLKPAVSKAVQACAVAGDVLAPVLPIRVALKLDAFAENAAGGLLSQELHE